MENRNIRLIPIEAKPAPRLRFYAIFPYVEQFYIKQEKYLHRRRGFYCQQKQRDDMDITVPTPH